MLGKLIKLTSHTTTGFPVSPTTLESSKNISELLKNAPIFKDVYSLGKAEGMRDGYIDASVIFEKKLKAQLIAFLEKEENLKLNVEELEKLLIEIEEFVKYLTNQTEMMRNKQLKLEESLQLELKPKK